MAYRNLDKKKPVRRVLQDTTTPNRTYVQNGATAYLAVPCWYMEARPPRKVGPHHRDHHDHWGWPDPVHPDESCQDTSHLDEVYRYHESEQGWHRVYRLLDMSRLIPIHLEREGYKTVEVAMERPPEGLTAGGRIDDFTVRFWFAPMCPAAVGTDVDVPYTVFAIGDIDEGRGRTRHVRDVVTKGTLRIVAGPIS